MFSILYDYFTLLQHSRYRHSITSQTFPPTPPSSSLRNYPICLAPSYLTNLTYYTYHCHKHFPFPPSATSCPSPFQLLAEGCYLVVHDTRDWRSWGEAYAFCQSYRGELAAPWRLQQLQDYLSRYYCKHAFFPLPLTHFFFPFP